MNTAFTSLTARALAAAVLAALTAQGHASTLVEDKIFSAPMPHTLLEQSGPTVKVHRVRLQGLMGSEADNATALAKLHQDVQQCVAERARQGMPTKPPQRWPDFILSARRDSYFARNRAIVYSHGSAHLLNTLDCSLIESDVATAALVSSKGTCNIDLIHKTASGACDAGAHADAIAVAMHHRPSETETNQALQKLAADPKTAAMAAAMRRMVPPEATHGTGQHKTILGIDCEVWNQMGGPDTGTVCLAHGGSFQPAISARNPVEAGIELEFLSKRGANMKAIDAQLDADVNSAVFAPYLADGYVVQDGKRK